MMPNSYPFDRIFNPHLTTIEVSYNILVNLILQSLSWISVLVQHYLEVQ